MRRRSGYSLVEVLVVLAILGIVGGAVMGLLTRQQRFYRNVNETVNVRRELRSGATLLPIEARSISTVGGDVLEMKATEFTFRATIGSSVACDVKQGSNAFLVPPTNLAHHTLTTWYSEPVQGDVIIAFDDSVQAGAEDDEWKEYVIRSKSKSTSDCLTSPLMDPVADAAALKPRWQFVTGGSPAISPTIKAGAVLRIVRPVRYSLYESGTGRWYLGFQEQKGGAWSAVEPVSGPYQAGGLEFTYRNGAGATTTDPAAVAAVGVTLRGASVAADMTDSLVFTIGIRNFQ